MDYTWHQSCGPSHTSFGPLVTANECRIRETFQDLSDLKSRYEALQATHHQLCIKVDDLEKRSRRCNLRVIGIPESVKGPHLIKFLQARLPELLNIQEECSGMVVERAHCLGLTRPEPNSRPRAVIFKSLSFVHKEAICTASRRHKDLRWHGSQSSSFSMT